MEVIVCLDDRNGMRFHGRRQSRDRRVVEDLLGRLEGNRLWIAPCSADLFAGREQEVQVSEQFLAQAGEQDVCLVEDRLLAEEEERIGTLVVYRWNRRYPADLRLDLRLGERWKLCGQEEFPGHSHETITREVYRK